MCCYNELHHIKITNADEYYCRFFLFFFGKKKKKKNIRGDYLIPRLGQVVGLKENLHWTYRLTTYSRIADSES